jgi:ribonuclease-3
LGVVSRSWDGGVNAGRDPAELRHALGVPIMPASLERALTHRSYAYENDNPPTNERLEFLGDSVLGLCVSELLVQSHPEADEGKLTRMRSALVNAEALAAWARSVGIGSCVAFGRGAQLGTEREQDNVLADGVEALVAAVYEARGLEGARALVKEVVRERFEHADTLSGLDPKSALQEEVQALRMPTPRYRVVAVKGAAHEQVFEVEVLVGEDALARGEGRSKRLAERAAAGQALAALRAR